MAVVRSAVDFLREIEAVEGVFWRLMVFNAGFACAALCCTPSVLLAYIKK